VPNSARRAGGDRRSFKGEISMIRGTGRNSWGVAMMNWGYALTEGAKERGVPLQNTKHGPEKNARRFAPSVEIPGGNMNRKNEVETPGGSLKWKT